MLPHKYTSWQPQNAKRKTSRVGSSKIQDKSSSLSLANIRSSLIRQEDTIIFNFIERAQFARNKPVYTPNVIPLPQQSIDETGGSSPLPKAETLLDYLLLGTERLHASVRRYTSPDEHAFFPNALPAPSLPLMSYPSSCLAPFAANINLNHKILRSYIDDVIPDITVDDDDCNYGSAATLDVQCLQALSKRIHYGKFVAEAKFKAHRAEYTRLIKAKDSEAIMTLLTDEVQEKRVLRRVAQKAASYGQDITNVGEVAPAPDRSGINSNNKDSSKDSTNFPSSSSSSSSSNNGAVGKYKVKPEVVARVYGEIVMPLTKEVELIYLLRRLEWDD
uniref:Chorismate mutase n=1 Tax=Polytomella parva TaxID=51329 RepID=A0A7S0V2C0_9CHLO|mmetsp:Transcript_22661/g.40148  ORF Transcript_22661/g.40148 Transcript_22661/m.40148 type:complete len:332 (+) Transcript_22661:56-1051(+)